MADKNIGAVVVQSEQRVEGIFSERDYARKVMLLGKTSKQTLVSEIMTRMSFVSSRMDRGQCMALMTEKRIRHLPVMQEGRLVGVVSIGDVVVEEQQSRSTRCSATSCRREPTHRDSGLAREGSGSATRDRFSGLPEPRAPAHDYSEYPFRTRA